MPPIDRQWPPCDAKDGTWVTGEIANDDNEDGILEQIAQVIWRVDVSVTILEADLEGLTYDRWLQHLQHGRQIVVHISLPRDMKPCDRLLPSRLRDCSYSGIRCELLVADEVTNHDHIIISLLLPHFKRKKDPTISMTCMNDLTLHVVQNSQLRINGRKLSHSMFFSRVFSFPFLAGWKSSWKL